MRVCSLILQNELEAPKFLHLTMNQVFDHVYLIKNCEKLDEFLFNILVAEK